MALSKITNLSITDDTILNADVNSSAAIALSKLATDPSNATNLASGTVPDARFPATLPAASGVNLTSLDAANLGSNTVPTARLGSGTASSTTVLYGDQTYKAEPTGGKLLQISQKIYGAAAGVSGTSLAYISPMTRNFSSLASTSSQIWIVASGGRLGTEDSTVVYKFYGQINGGGYSSISPGDTFRVVTDTSKPSGLGICFTYLWAPSTTDSIDVQLWGKGTNGGTANTADSQLMLTIMEIGG